MPRELHSIYSLMMQSGDFCGSSLVPEKMVNLVGIAFCHLQLVHQLCVLSQTGRTLPLMVTYRLDYCSASLHGIALEDGLETQLMQNLSAKSAKLVLETVFVEPLLHSSCKDTWKFQSWYALRCTEAIYDPFKNIHQNLYSGTGLKVYRAPSKNSLQQDHSVSPLVCSSSVSQLKSVVQGLSKVQGQM